MEKEDDEMDFVDDDEIIHHYPPQELDFRKATDRNSLQKYIAENYEFSSLGVGATEEKLNNERFYSQQKLDSIFLYIWDRLLAFNDVGTGKMYAAIATASNLRNSNKNVAVAYLNGTMKKINKCFIIVNSKEIKHLFINKIKEFYIKYYNEKINISIDKIHSDTYYNVLMVGQLATQTHKITSDDELSKIFSYSICIIDESHYFRKTEEKVDKIKKTYLEVKRIIHVSKNIKVLNTTATPTVNNPLDIIYIVNPMLPPDFQINIDPKTYTNKNAKDLQKYFYNYVSYFRASSTEVKTVYKGTKINKYNTLQLIPMGLDKKNGDWVGQEIVYDKLWKKEKKNDNINPRFKYSNAVFEDDMFEDGKELVKNIKDKYILEIKVKIGKKDKVSFEWKNNYDDTIRGDEKWTLDYLMPKFRFIADMCDNRKYGIVYVYDKLITTLGGAIHFSLVLKTYKNFQEYNAGNEIYIDNNNRLKLKSNEYNKSNYKRYVLTTGQTTPTNRNIIFSILNHPDNYTGKFIKVIMLGPASKQGINLANIGNVVLTNPNWHPADDEQVIGRANRIGLSKEKIDALREKEGSKAILEQPIFLMTSIHSEDVKFLNYYKTFEEQIKHIDEILSIDLKTYLRSTRKDISNKKVERRMKIMAIDAIIHKERNILKTDQDYTPKADYDLANYEFYEKNVNSEINYKNYDLLYSDNEINHIIEYLKKYFKTNNSIIINDIYNDMTLGKKRKMLVTRTIYKIIKEQIIFRNRLGFLCYVIENDETLFLTRKLPILEKKIKENIVSDIYYSANQESVYVLSFREITSGISKDSDEFSELFDVQNYDEYLKIFLNFNEENKRKLLEKLYLLEVITENEEKLLERFSNLIITIPKPIGLIEYHNKKNIKRKKGRPVKIQSQIEKESFSVLKNKTGKNITIHAITENIEVLTKNDNKPIIKNPPSKSTKVRILVDGKWGTPDTISSIIYLNKIVDHLLEVRRNILEEHYIYGIVSSITDKFMISHNVEQDKKDNRKFNTGRKCSKSTKHIAFKAFRKWGIPIDDDYFPTGHMTDISEVTNKHAIITLYSLNKNSSDDDILYFANWDMKGTHVCNLIRNIFEIEKVFIVI